MKFFPDHVHRLFLDTPGALSVHEGMALFDLMGSVPDVGLCVECGSHAGKSAIAIAAGLGQRYEASALHMIDPIFDGEGNAEWGYANQPGFAADVMNRVMDATGTGDRSKDWEFTCKVKAELHSYNSDVALPMIYYMSDRKGFAFAFLDSGDHSYELVRSEFDFLKDKMVPGGLIVFHDIDNYSGPTSVFEEAQWEGFASVNICWNEIHALVEAHGGEAINKSWHMVGNPRPQFLAAIRK